MEELQHDSIITYFFLLLLLLLLRGSKTLEIRFCTAVFRNVNLGGKIRFFAFAIKYETAIISRWIVTDCCAGIALTSMVVDNSDSHLI